MVGKKKKAQRAKAEATIAAKAARRSGPKQERRAHKLAQRLEKRKQEKKGYTADMWAAPAPTHLIAKLDQPKIKSKHQSYFEFADNPEKKQKKLEFQVTNKSLDKYPGYAFVPIGDPLLSNECKELSRNQDAMVFIVSSQAQTQENTKISEHIHRTGYYFREAIVNQAREIVGETVISNPTILPGTVEPIPESQDEINKQADAAIRDLFPRIPNPDRIMIIEHAFKKGAVFHGEPTVGLQASIPLSRRVQLAVLAHIRHTHTRYDKLLRETSWMNARKAVEPVCLDVLIKWRGDEETGRDQMDEILREVVIITDSEDEDDSSEEDSSDDDGEITSASSTEPPSRPNSRNQQSIPGSQAIHNFNTAAPARAIQTISSAISSRTRSKDPRDKKEQRGFKRYQAAWEDAINRRQAPRANSGTPFEDSVVSRPRSGVAVHATASCHTPAEFRTHTIHPQQRPSGGARSEVIHPHSEHAVYYQEVLPQRPENTRYVGHQSIPEHSRITSSPQYLSMGYQPPQVVRRSPVKHGLEDFLVPSIETSSSDISSPRIREWNGLRAHDSIIHSRVVGPLGQTPARQVIVIDDESPQVKRRGVVREDESRDFRSIPSRDHTFHPPTSLSDSLSLRTSSSAQFGTIASPSIIRSSRAPTQATQGLLRNRETLYTDPVTGERLPVYEAPEPGYMKNRPEYTETGNIGLRAGQQEDGRGIRPMGYYQALNESYHRQPIHVQRGSDIPEPNVRGGIARQQDPVYSTGHQMRPISPRFPVSHQPSHSYDMSDRRGGPDQDFIQSFSQSRLDGPSSLSRDGFISIPARSQDNYVPPGSSSYQDDRIVSYAPTSRARSPVRYVERAPKSRELPQQPVYYDLGHPNHSHHRVFHNQSAAPLPERQPASSEEVPMYVRTIPPSTTRRPVIYLD
ncbi:uncharacterized protein RAG0_08627 [Rhynchosporium agropyri]|uniref:DUF2293 domain-containing protein n=1 Tax=Rhynchosporium agropyri TaxID=914238 RepID=A0A1E1KRP6_9HELO|nr:uncharacterized protein RAG0_08627 [Rhynchosporium agropyri]